MFLYVCGGVWRLTVVITFSPATHHTNTQPAPPPQKNTTTNQKKALAVGHGPYFYLPKMEGHLEARLWNDAFNLAQVRGG